MKLGIIANKFYVNKFQIKNFLFMIQQQFENDEIEIVNLNRKNYIEKEIKKIINSANLKYSEFIPYHEKWNPNCVEKPWLFKNKSFKPKYYYIAATNLIKYCDNILILDSKDGNDPIIKFSKDMCKKLQKNYVILKD